ncbi:MAG: hypothetical protein WAT79_01005 [Saprospiraceae bacterium]
MSFTVAIDISTFIWCEDDFKNNKKQYFVLKTLAPNVYSQIRELKLPILLRDELYQSIMNEFPYNMVKEIGYDFQKLTLEFLTDNFSNWSLYTVNNDTSITTLPILKKPHFSDKIQVESQSQISHIFHNSQHSEHKYIAYNYFFNNGSNLVLNKEDKSIEVDTLRFSTEKEIEEFFKNFKITFEHHTKHRKELYYDYERKEDVSPFSCYHNQGQIASQDLLDKAIFYNGHYYNFDLENNVFVRFIKTKELIYHGHDLLDEGNNIPNQVKKKLSK